MDIVYRNGDATLPFGDGCRVIVHICNDRGGWGKGFVVAVSKRWKQPEREYRRWFRERGGGTLPLGEVQFVPVDEGLWVANMVAQQGMGQKHGPPIRYDAVRTGLRQVAVFCTEQQASVHMPRIGSGLAGGSWPEIEAIIQQEVIARGIPVTVYEFEATRTAIAP